MEHSLWEYHIMGGTEYMTPITLTLLANLVIVALLLRDTIQKKARNEKLLEAVRQLGGLALALGAFGTIVGFFQIFDALEKSKEVIPFEVIMGGMKVALITVIYGLIVCCLSLIAFVAWRLAGRK